MPSIHISALYGTPFEVMNEKGDWADLTALNGKLVRVSHATVNEIVIEVEEEMSPTTIGGR